MMTVPALISTKYSQTRMLVKIACFNILDLHFNQFLTVYSKFKKKREVTIDGFHCDVIKIARFYEFLFTLG